MTKQVKALKNLRLSATIWEEKEGFVSKCPELNVASCGDTIEEALSNLKEAVELYIENLAAIELQEVLNEMEEHKLMFNTFRNSCYNTGSGRHIKGRIWKEIEGDMRKPVFFSLLL